MSHLATPAQPLAPVRRRRRPTLVLGLLMLLVGLSLLGYLGWEYWGTTWVSHRTQHRIVQSTEQQWSQPHGGQGSVRVSQGSVSAIVRIPRFGADYAVPVLDGTSDAILAAGFGHFTTSAPAGGLGSYAIAGHRVTHGEPLRDMPDLRPGDQVIVETQRRVFTYVIDNNDLTIPMSEDWVSRTPLVDPADRGLVPDQPRILTLVTCASLFHTDNRSVAFGHLVSSAPRTG
jgi:sortase A